MTTGQVPRQLQALQSAACHIHFSAGRVEGVVRKATQTGVCSVPRRGCSFPRGAASFSRGGCFSCSQGSVPLPSVCFFPRRRLSSHQPVGPGRRPGNFLLLAQKKVTKEEGLNTICLADVAKDPRRLLGERGPRGTEQWLRQPKTKNPLTRSGLSFQGLPRPSRWPESSSTCISRTLLQVVRPRSYSGSLLWLLSFEPANESDPAVGRNRRALPRTQRATNVKTPSPSATTSRSPARRSARPD